MENDERALKINLEDNAALNHLELDTNLDEDQKNHATFVPWMDDENLLLDSYDLDDQMNLVIQRISSDQIVYREKCKRYKMFGNRFVMGDLLGEGSYGKVKECIDSETLIRRAVKILKRKKLKRIYNGEKSVNKEIKLLRRLNHINVIGLVDVCNDEVKEKMYLVMEYCVGSLQDILNKLPAKKLSIFHSHYFFKQLIEGLSYLHSQRIVHKDIKPGNLLVTIDGILKIIDFGIAEEIDFFSVDDTCKMGQGTPTFLPPEIASGQESFSGFKFDVWSCGVTLYNLSTGKYPFEGENIYRLFENISLGHFTIPDCLDACLKSLISGMLKINPDERFDLEQVRRHEWILRKPFNEHSPQGKNESVIFSLPIVRGDDKLYPLTVLPYLEDYFYASDNSSENNNDSLTVVEKVPKSENEDRLTKSLSHLSFQNQNNKSYSKSSKLLGSQDTDIKTTSCISIKRRLPSSCKLS